MKLGKIIKRLRKELLGNPKQAAVLGIVCLIALWFWSPLLLKWFGGKSGAVAKGAKSAEVDEVTLPNNMPSTTESQINWFQIKSYRDADPLTRTASIANTDRDPFYIPRTQTAETGDEHTEVNDEGARRETAELDIDKLGLTLESIAYGSQRRRAQINGQTVKENDLVSLGEAISQAAGSQLAAQVVAIRLSEVELNVRGQTVLLKLPMKALGRGNLVQRMQSASQSSESHP